MEDGGDEWPREQEKPASCVGATPPPLGLRVSSAQQLTCSTLTHKLQRWEHRVPLNSGINKRGVRNMGPPTSHEECPRPPQCLWT